MKNEQIQQGHPVEATLYPQRPVSRWLGFWQYCCRVMLVQPSWLSYIEPIWQWLKPGFLAHWPSARLIRVDKDPNFITLQLKPDWRWRGFIPGQHIDLILQHRGMLLQRSFSISSSLAQFQQQGTVTLTIQQQPGGLFTDHRQGLLLPDQSGAVDQHLWLSQAQGDFYLRQQQPGLLLAAGAGITPIHAMLMSLNRLVQPLTLIYSFRGHHQLLFAEDWLRLQQKFPLLQIQLVDTTQQRRVNSADIAAILAQQPDSMVYLCGPVAFSQQWRSQLQTLGVDPGQIVQESFGGQQLSQTVASEQFQLRVTTKGGSNQLVPSQGSLLTSLENAGLKPEYGCRRGICMQCICLKTQGQVIDLRNGSLSSTGQEQIQLCISQAASDLQLQLL